MKIALVHDYLTQYGGAERTLESVARIWPQAPVFTSIWDKKKLSQQGFSLQKNEIKTSFLQKFPFKRKFATTYYLPLYPVAFENFIFNNFDVAFSINSYASKAVITKPETLHICYCCTPPRHLWDFRNYVQGHKTVKRRHKIVLKPMISYLRLWDQVAATRVDKYIAISSAVKKRIGQIYKRDAIVIFPPVNVKKFRKKKKIQEKDFFLIVSRLASHKKIDLAIKAFNKMLDKKLIIIGDGPMEKEYKKKVSPNIKLLGRLTDEEVIGYYQNCLAFLYPQEEDFGITAVEAQAAGSPVIGYGKGGILDTVEEGRTELFFEKQTIKALIKVIKDFDSDCFLKEDCAKNAEKFSERVFKDKIKTLVEKEWERRKI